MGHAKVKGAGVEEPDGWLQASCSVHHKGPGIETPCLPGFPSIHPWSPYKCLFFFCSLISLAGLITEHKCIGSEVQRLMLWPEE